MTEAQRALLFDLYGCGGCWDKNNRIVAGGTAHHKDTVLTAFRWAWITSTKEGRVLLTAHGRKAIEDTP
jgi:hypothetical protein